METYKYVETMLNKERHKWKKWNSHLYLQSDQEYSRTQKTTNQTEDKNS